MLNCHIRKMEPIKPSVPVNKVRIVTAASLYDGHDATINIMRRIVLLTGVEVIHLGRDNYYSNGGKRASHNSYPADYK